MNRNIRANQFVGKLLLLLFLLVASCKKGDEPIPEDTTETAASKSSRKELLGITILQSQNTGITSDAYVYRSSYKYYITIPLQSSLTDIFVNFTVSDRASIKIDGKLMSDNAGHFDLSKTLEALVVAEDGSVSATYTIMAQVGIKEIDAMIYPFIEKYDIPAASYAIGRNSLEEIVYKNACGFAVTEAKERAVPNHLFRLGSMTKQHTAIAIMALIQNGKIAIDDLVFGPTGILKSYWPSVGPMSSKVTVRHLLEHTAGYSGDPMFSSTYTGYSLERRIDVMLGSNQSTPGTTFTYYNMGYGTLGKIIEEVSGKDYEIFIQEIYAPVGVKDLHLSASSKDTRRDNEAECYGQNGNNAYGNDIAVYKAAGGIIMNTDELFNVLYSVDGGSIHPDMLNSDIRTLMLTPSQVFSGYAKGWRTNHSLFEGYYHGGNLAGTATFWIYGTKYSAAILLNSRSYDSNFDTELIVLTNNVMEKASSLGL